MKLYNLKLLHLTSTVDGDKKICAETDMSIREYSTSQSEELKW